MQIYVTCFFDRIAILFCLLEENPKYFRKSISADISSAFFMECLLKMPPYFIYIFLFLFMCLLKFSPSSL